MRRKVAQGPRKKCGDYLKNNPEVKAEIDAKIREAHKAALRKKD